MQRSSPINLTGLSLPLVWLSNVAFAVCTKRVSIESYNSNQPGPSCCKHIKHATSMHQPQRHCLAHASTSSLGVWQAVQRCSICWQHTVVSTPVMLGTLYQLFLLTQSWPADELSGDLVCLCMRSFRTCMLWFCALLLYCG